MMKRPLREVLCGLLIGLLIMPAQPAQAQWATFDSAAFGQRAKSEIKRVKEWLDTIRHYQMLYTNAVEQLTTLGGVLERVDKELAKDKELARLTNDISDIIRGTRQLKNQIENQTRYQIAALQRIDNRVRNGIFDPEQDLQDLENYLLYSMGRNSKQTLRRAVNTAKADAILRVWMDERRDLTEQRARAYEKLKELEKALNQAIYQTEMLIGKLERDIAALEEKIQQRLNAHGLRLSDMENFAYQIESSKAAWLELQQTKQEIDKAFDAAVVEMNNTP